MTDTMRRQTLALGTAAVLALVNVLNGSAKNAWISFIAIGGLALAARLGRHSESGRPIRLAVFWAAILLIAGLGFRLLTEGEAPDPELAQRVLMIPLGLFLTALASDVPKLLRPLAAGSEARWAKEQVLRRHIGWTQTLGGLGFTFCWIMLPADIALPTSVACILLASAAAAVRILQSRKDTECGQN